MLEIQNEIQRKERYKKIRSNILRGIAACSVTFIILRQSITYNKISIIAAETQYNEMCQSKTITVKKVRDVPENTEMSIIDYIDENLNAELEIEETSIAVAEEEAKNAITYDDKDAPSNNHFKSYMDKNTITDHYSEQYAFMQAATLDDTGVWMVDDRYCIAVGSYYTKQIGTYIDLIMENGEIIPCILGECKSDDDTDSATQRQNPNGSIAEFIVNERALPNSVKAKGSLSALGGMFDGEIETIRVYT